MKDYWSKLKLSVQSNKRNRFNYLMSKIDEAVVGDSELAEKVNNLIGKLENIIIPTKLSELENDEGFITEHQSLDNYITKSETTGLICNTGEIDTTDYLTTNDISDVIHISNVSGLIRNDGSIDVNTYLTNHQDISGKADKLELSTVAFSGDYLDLENKPEIPDISDVVHTSNTRGLLMNDGSVDTTVYLTEHQDITHKADKSELRSVAFSNDYEDLNNKPSIPINTSDLVNDSGFVVTDNLNDYIPKSSTSGLIRNDGSIDTTNYLSEHQDITSKIERSELFNNGVFTTINTNSNGTVAKILNEADGGGTQIIDGTTNVQAYTGVHEGSDGSNIYVQTYAVDKTSKLGTRININQSGAYYTKNKNTPTWTNDDEIATQGDLSDLEIRISALESLIKTNDNPEEENEL